MATLTLPTLSRRAPVQVCATTKLVVVAQRPLVRHGYVVVAHAQASARWLPDMWLTLFLLAWVKLGDKDHVDDPWSFVPIFHSEST
jgi:hypothetical protein